MAAGGPPNLLEETSMKVQVINAEPQELDAALREWLTQHPRARIGASTSSSAADGTGKVIVTIVIWYQE
jgi:hypothetical protein